MANLYSITDFIEFCSRCTLTKTVNMDDTKIEKLMERLLLKNNEILDEKPNRVSEKLSTIENNIKTEINQIKEDIISVKCSNQVEFNKINVTVQSIEDSQHLILEEFEKQKQNIYQLLEDNKKIHLDNTRLHHELNNMKLVVNDNRIEVNRELPSIIDHPLCWRYQEYLVLTKMKMCQIFKTD